jgi:AraC family transcriptional regulator
MEQRSGNASEVPVMSRSSPALKLASAQFPSGSSQWAAPTARNIISIPYRPREPDRNRGGGANDDAAVPRVDISPRENVSRSARRWDGMAAEIVQMTRRSRIDIRFHARVHLLVIAEQGVRTTGETSVEGLPRSTLRDLRRKISFVPAGHDYHEWLQPSLLPRVTYFYFDPAKLAHLLEPEYMDALRTPRLFFEDAPLWETALKLGRLIEAPAIEGDRCVEALGVILAHELARPALASRQSALPARGGLAAWHQRILVDYIEEHLAERISLTNLAELVQLSPYHVCRAFKESFGVPPLRYHTSRRIERAKALLAKPDCSVTDIGMAVGFSDTSSFSAAFRKATGMTPTAYHRSVG